MRTLIYAAAALIVALYVVVRFFARRANRREQCEEQDERGFRWDDEAMDT